MSSDDNFEPRLGRMRAKGSRKGRRFLSKVLAAANLARAGGSGTSGRRQFDGSRIGRGSGVGRVLARRDHFAAVRARRVIVKASIVKLAGKGGGAARAHLRYVERDGTTREGGRGQLYGAQSDALEAKPFQEKAEGDRHQFRFIVSPEDGAEYDDLKPLTRRLMARIEEDLGTRLDWVAVDHFNTGHPHTHIIVRGKDERGKDLIIAREYLTRGIRERAAELIDLDLGPPTIDAIKDRQTSEIAQERLTNIDRALLRDADPMRLLSAAASDAFDQTVRTGRLRKLERMGLATPLGGTSWRLAPDLSETLTRMGERGDIVRTMQRAFAARQRVPALADQAIYDPGAADARPLVGRIVERGLADEAHDRHYLLVEATDGRSHYVAIGKGENVEPHARGAIVRIEPQRADVRDVDRTVAAVATRNGGRYDIDAHLRYDPAATEAFAQAHVRRLEAIRRLTGGVTRLADGSFAIADDHIDRALAYEAARARDRPVAVETLSPQPLEQLTDADAATWLDRELLAASPAPLRDAGFGHDAREAQLRRRQWLIAQGFAAAGADRTVYPKGMIDALERREIQRVSAQLSRELGLPFAETASGNGVAGIYRKPVAMISGRYALIEKSREFTLVPWRPVLERYVGKTVSGIMRADGINWSLGRGRSGPSIS